MGEKDCFEEGKAERFLFLGEEKTSEEDGDGEKKSLGGHDIREGR